MLVGHVDIVTSTFIGGWAADNANPDATVEVSVYVDGERVAQIPCQRLRHDLKGLHGQGRHGFSHSFASPLPPSARISARFVETGDPLPPGAVIVGDAAPSPGARMISVHDLDVAEAIFPTEELPLRNICRFSNASDQLKARWAPAYASRVARPHGIDLVRLPRATRVSGSDFSVLVGTKLLIEQVEWLAPGAPALPPSVTDRENKLLANFDARRPVDDISDESILVARYGEATWGHLLIELLPKIAIAERFWPGRFKFVMPAWIMGERPLRERVAEAIRAYGVREDRLILVRRQGVYRFSGLYAVTPVYSDYIPHPGIAEVMQAVVSPDPTPALARIAVLRNDGRRRISNLNEVLDFLRRQRFELIEAGSQSFIEQVRIFRSGLSVVSVLGSTLSGLLYSPAGIRVVAVAPEEFSDRFFYGIAQTKPGSSWAEVRGPIVEKDSRFHANSSFNLRLEALEFALASLGL